MAAHSRATCIACMSSNCAARLGPLQWGRDYYHWYYVSLMLMQVQNETWKSWNKEMAQTLLSLQRGDGHANGSWDPDRELYAIAGREAPIEEELKRQEDEAARQL